jgi:hypothetical protein
MTTVQELPVKKPLTTTQCKRIWQEAKEAAEQAIINTIPTPMVVGTPTDFLGSDIDYTKPTYYVAGGVCGFGWVNISPARGKFVQFLKSEGIGYKDYYGGWSVSAHEIATIPGGQSYELKMAAAGAAARVFESWGISCYATGRLD